MGALSITEDSFKLTVSEIYEIEVEACRYHDRKQMAEFVAQLELTNIQQIREQMIELWLGKYHHPHSWEITIAESRYSPQGHTPEYIGIYIYEWMVRQPIRVRFIPKNNFTPTEQDMHNEFISTYDNDHRFILYNPFKEKYEDFDGF